MHRYSETSKCSELEQYLFKDNFEWCRSDFPEEGLKVYDGGVAEGIPTGMGWHEDTGHFVLMSGQGPMMAWYDNYEKHKMEDCDPDDENIKKKL